MVKGGFGILFSSLTPLECGALGAEFVALEGAVAFQELFLFRFGDAQLRAAHVGGFDQAFVVQDDFDARHGFDDRFAEDQFFHRLQFFLDSKRFVELAGAAGEVHGAPFFGGDVGDADERAVGAQLITLGDEAVVAGEDAHGGFVALQLLGGVGKQFDVEGGFFEGDDVFQTGDAADGVGIVVVAFHRDLKQHDREFGFRAPGLRRSELSRLLSTLPQENSSGGKIITPSTAEIFQIVHERDRFVGGLGRDGGDMDFAGVAGDLAADFVDLAFFFDA